MEEEGGGVREQRVDRELIELLNELRVALPDVSGDLRFLADRPVRAALRRDRRWAATERLGTLVLLTLSSLLLIAPAAQDLVLFRQHDKEALLLRANRYARAVVTSLAAVSLGVFLVVDVVFPGLVAVVVAAGCLLAGGWWWVALPQWRLRHGGQDALPTR